LELLVVITVIALATGLSVLALRDSARSQLEQEAARLSALLDAARVESRTTGRPITWRPSSGPQPTAPTGANPPPNTRAGEPVARDFIFEPPGTGQEWPSRWLHEGTSAEVIGAPRLVLGPEPLIPAQRVRLRLGQQQLVLATDGLRGFSVEDVR
jgi:general secretion pathway protein H